MLPKTCTAEGGESVPPQTCAPQTSAPYVVHIRIVDDDSPSSSSPSPGLAVHYTRAQLRSTLTLMGVKPRYAARAAEAAFAMLEQRLAGTSGEAPATALSPRRTCTCVDGDRAGARDWLRGTQAGMPLIGACQGRDSGAPRQDGQCAAGADTCGAPGVEQLRPGQFAVMLPRTEFLALVQAALAACHPWESVSLEDLQVACSLRERRSSVTLLLCGTSGTGKSTLASLTAQRLGITTLLSTDSIRHMMRSFEDEATNPLLWVSTYQAGELIAAGGLPGWEGVPRDARTLAVKGYKAQCEMVMEHLERLIGSCEARGESLVVEGVHLSLGFLLQLMGRHPSVVPFLVHISNEAKHCERFAVRAKYMTLEPAGNRYVQYLRTIRTIQEYLVRLADKHCIPKIDNTNVDRSVATIHATLLGCLRRRARGEALLDASTRTCPALLAEYLRCRSATWSSKDMLEIIRRKRQYAHGRAASGGGEERSGRREVEDEDWDAPSSSSAATPSGPLSEAGELFDWRDDGKSFYGVDDADELGSDDGGSGSGQLDGGSSDEELGGAAGHGGAVHDAHDETGSVTSAGQEGEGEEEAFDLELRQAQGLAALVSPLAVR